MGLLYMWLVIFNCNLSIFMVCPPCIHKHLKSVCGAYWDQTHKITWYGSRHWLGSIRNSWLSIKCAATLSFLSSNYANIRWPTCKGTCTCTAIQPLLEALVPLDSRRWNQANCSQPIAVFHHNILMIGNQSQCHGTLTETPTYSVGCEAPWTAGLLCNTASSSGCKQT